MGPYEQGVIRAVAQGAATPYEVAARSGDPYAEVLDALRRLVEAGLIEAGDGRVRLTEAGIRMGAPVGPRHAAEPAPADVAVPVAQALDALQSMGSSWVTRASRQSGDRTAAARALLASDADRDRAVQQLEDAYAQGRLVSAELDERTGRALAARTLGELDQTLDGLGGLADPAQPAARHPVRTMVFWLATVLFSPFLLFGILFVLFGDDLGSHVAGLVFVAVTAPPLFCLWRWSRRTVA